MIANNPTNAPPPSPSQPSSQPSSSPSAPPQGALSPLWLLASLTLPQGLLWSMMYAQYRLIQSLLTEESRTLWWQYGFATGAGIVLFTLIALFYTLRRRSLPAWLAPLLLIAYIALLYFYFYDTRNLFPFSLPPWTVEQDEMIFLVAGLIMPILLHALAMIIAYLTPPKEKQAAWPSLFYALAIPLFWYTFGQILTPLLRKVSEISHHLLFIGFIAITLLFFFFLLRGLFLLAESSLQSEALLPFLRLLIALVFPLAGLAVYNGFFSMRGYIYIPPIVGNLSDPLFFVVALFAAAVILAPTPDAPLPRIGLFSLRIIAYPYTIYFFLIFLPFLPLSLIAILAFGLGFLMLAPLFLMALHTHQLFHEYKALRLHYHRFWIALLALLSFLVLPAAILTAMLQERTTLHRALAYLYQPDSLRTTEPAIKLHRLRRSLDALQTYHKRRRRPRNALRQEHTTPLLTSLYKRIVLDNMSLSATKLHEMERLFFAKETPHATTTTSATLPTPAAPLATPTTPIPPTTPPLENPPRATFPPSSLPTNPLPSSQPANAIQHPQTHHTTASSSVNAPSLPPRQEPPVVHINGTQEDTTYDQHTQTYRTTLTLWIRNPTPREQEFSTTFRLPLGVFVNDYALWIDGKRVPGILTEKKATLWIYQQIVRARQDPGLLYYEDAHNLRLRVFPVFAHNSRKTSFTLLYKQPFPLQIERYRFHLGKPAHTSQTPLTSQTPPTSQPTTHTPQPTTHTPQPTTPLSSPTTRSLAHLPAIPPTLSIQRLWDDRLLFFSKEAKAALPRIQRKAFLHIILDASHGKKKHYHRYLEQLTALHRRFGFNPKETRITLANYQAFTYPWDESLPQKLHSFPAQGGLFLRRILKRIHLEHHTKARHDFPLVIVLTPALKDALLDNRFDGISFLTPDHPFFYSLNDHDQITQHPLQHAEKDTPLGHLSQQTNALFAPRHVRIWPDAQRPQIFLPDDPNETLALRLQAYNQLPQISLPKDPWQAGLALHARWLLQRLHLGGQHGWLEQIRWSWRTHLLSHQTSFSVFETEAQWEALRRKQQQVLAGQSFFDLTDDAPLRGDEPSLWLLFLLLSLFFLYRARFL